MSGLWLPSGEYQSAGRLDGEDRLADAFVEEAGLLAELPVLELEVTPLQAWLLLSQLQLALRHPANAGVGADFARALAQVLIEYCAPTPALQEMARRGWDPNYDEPAL